MHGGLCEQWETERMQQRSSAHIRIFRELFRLSFKKFYETN